MVWSDAVRVSPNPFDQGAGSERADAYLCTEGHNSPKCPKCGSYQTAARVAPGDPPTSVTIQCEACGTKSIVARKA
jgi:hypothetical protein